MKSACLEKIIRELMGLKKEGVYWDFKQEHHSNPTEFIHDVICLANAKHDGDKYLIFGIEDNFTVAGLKTLKKQADLISTLRDAHFADGSFPDISLDNLTLDEANIQVLTIRNTINKPYYLTKDKTGSKSGKNITLSAGTIYTRVMDTNTPKNNVASSRDIEHMWKERFGLTQAPVERFKIYLNDFEGWETRGELSYYKQFPEFTIQPLENNGGDKKQNEWARGEIGYHYDHGNGTSILGFYYHNTLLEKVSCEIFDGGKKYIIAPDWEAIGEGRFYFYLEDSFEYIYQKFLIKETKKDFSKEIRSKKGFEFDIPIFSNKSELNRFLENAKKFFNHDKFESPTSDENEQNELFYKYIEYYTSLH